MLKKIVLVFAAVALAKAQIPSLGWCPEYVPMANFDLGKFLGVWYEAERYFQLTEVVSRCVTANYTKGADGKIRVSNEVTNRFTGIKRVLEGEIKPAASKSEEGKLQVKYTTVPLTPETQYSVLETDYKNYAVLWSCSGIGPVHAQNAWLMTRKRVASGETLQQAYGVLDKYKISKRYFVKTDQAECAYEAPEEEAPVVEAAAPAPVEEVPVKEEAEKIEPTAAKKSLEGVLLRSAAIPQEVEPVSDSHKEEAIAVVPVAPVAEESSGAVRIANAEPAKVPAVEQPISEISKPEETILKAIAPETIPEVILKVAESAKEAAAPLAEEPQSGANAVAEESKTVEIVVPAEAIPAPLVLPEEPKIVEAQEAVKTAEIPKTPEAEPEKETKPVELPKLAEETVKIAEELPKPVEAAAAPEAPEASTAARSTLIAEEAAPEIAAPQPATVDLSPAPVAITKAVEEIAEEVKISDPVPAVAVKSVEVPEAAAPAPEVPVLEVAAPAKILESAEQLLKTPEASALPETIAEAPAAPVKTLEVPAEESKPEAIEAKP